MVQRPLTADDILLNEVRRQVETYFSPHYIQQDPLFQQILTTHRGCCPLCLLGHYPMIQHIYQTAGRRTETVESLIIRALEHSRFVGLTGDHCYAFSMNTSFQNPQYQYQGHSMNGPETFEISYPTTNEFGKCNDAGTQSTMNTSSASGSPTSFATMESTMSTDGNVVQSHAYFPPISGYPRGFIVGSQGRPGTPPLTRPIPRPPPAVVYQQPYFPHVGVPPNTPASATGASPASSTPASPVRYHSQVAGLTWPHGQQAPTSYPSAATIGNQYPSQTQTLAVFGSTADHHQSHYYGFPGMGYTDQPNYDSSTVGSGPYFEHGVVQGEEKFSHLTSTQPTNFHPHELQQKQEQPRSLNKHRTKKPNRNKGQQSRNSRKNRYGPNREKEDGIAKDNQKQTDEATKALAVDAVGKPNAEVPSQPTKADQGVNELAETTNPAAKENADAQKASETDLIEKQMNKLSVE